MGILFLPTFAVGLVMMFIRLGLLAKKKQKEQRLVVKLSALMFVAGFVLAGLGQRFG